jgi:hypothetical protein
MQQRLEVGYFITKREDLLINACFCKLLGQDSLIEFKLPSKFENSRYKNILQFGNLLEFELIKTRKHWILVNLELKNKLNFSQWSYFKYEILSNMVQVIIKNLHPDQECHVLEIVTRNIQKLDFETTQNKNFIINFEQDFMQALGFK